MAIPLIVFVPWLVAYLDTPHAVAGALIGGTLDSTSAVAAATDRIGPLAVKIGLVTKFSQNMLVSLIAFLIAIWWTFKKAPTTTLPAKKERNKYSILWRRFPKFVLGLLAVSLLFSFVIPKNDAKAISPILDGFRIVWFSIAFVSIGIETSQTLSFKFTNSKPAITFVIAQLFNLLWATIWAYILFGGNTFDLPFLEFDR